MSEIDGHEIDGGEVDGSALDGDAVDHHAVGQPGGSAARIAALAVGAAVLGLLALFISSDPRGRVEEPNRLLGGRVPEMRGVAVDGRSFNIDNLRGEWVIVNFFATWCPPCIAEHPDLVRLEEWGEANGRLALVSVAFNETPEKVQAFFDERGGGWPVLDDADLSVEFQIALIPESFLIAPSGLVFQHFLGGIRADDLIAIIEANDLPPEQGGVGTRSAEPAPETGEGG